MPPPKLIARLPHGLMTMREGRQAAAYLRSSDSLASCLTC